MNADYEPVDAAPAQTARRRSWAAMLILPILFFLMGLLVMGWLLARWDYGAQMLGVAPEPAPVAAPAPQPVEPAPAAAPSAERIIVDPEVTRRVSQLEQRIGQIDQQARATVGYADRAEGLLVAFAARRALDRGVQLGFLEALLRQRFGETQPQAVGTVITAAREPVTLQELQQGLQEAAPQLTGVGPDQGWWEAFKAEMGSLITVRREGTPPTEPAERLRRASRQLEAGQVDVALAEVLRLPGRANAREWIEDARRYIAARRALDTIETAALLEPRTGAQGGAAAAPALPAAPAPGAQQPESQAVPN